MDKIGRWGRHLEGLDERLRSLKTKVLYTCNFFVLGTKLKLIIQLSGTKPALDSSPQLKKGIRRLAKSLNLLDGYIKSDETNRPCTVL